MAADATNVGVQAFCGLRSRHSTTTARSEQSSGEAFQIGRGNRIRRLPDRNLDQTIDRRPTEAIRQGRPKSLFHKHLIEMVGDPAGRNGPGVSPPLGKTHAGRKLPTQRIITPICQVVGGEFDPFGHSLGEKPTQHAIQKRVRFHGRHVARGAFGIAGYYPRGNQIERNRSESSAESVKSRSMPAMTAPRRGRCKHIATY